MSPSRRAALAAGLVLCAALASPAWAQVRAPGKPPMANTAEAGLWDLSHRAEVQARARADLNRDPALNAWVSQMTCQIAGEHCADIRVSVMDRPVFNAMVMPNGFVEVWSGLMLRATTADELAFVLGHEVGHFLEEHSFERLRREKITQNVMLAVSLGAAAAGAYYQVDVSDLIDAVYLTGVSAHFAYSRAHESQSDQMGLDRVAALGLNPGAGRLIWENQLAETAASSFSRVRRAEAFGSAFRTHPLTAERVSALRAQGERLGVREVQVEDRRQYRAMIRPHLGHWIEDEHRHRDYGRLLHLLDRLGQDGEDLGLIFYHRGEVHRRRREAGDDLLAVAAYRVSVEHDDAPVEAWRELGTIEARLGNTAAARDAFSQYLNKAPTADDHWIIEDQLAQLERKTDA